ncbi:stage II sporulation protein M [Streptomyces sp. NPDC050658]|uniref:stage II sporulation protein M n=1 Tax=unclassified Streptomyces TaxID=2593676 RepID=UPI003449FDC0
MLQESRRDRPTGIPAAVPGLLRRQWPALLAGSVLWFTAFAVGWANSGGDGHGAKRVHQQGDWSLFQEILVRNVGVSAALFLGVVTAGLLTIPLAFVTGMLAGYSWGQGLDVLSGADVVRHLLPHMPLELACIALSAGAGLVPMVMWARSGLGKSAGPRKGFGNGLGISDACRLWGISLVGLVVAAGVETWVST